MSTRREKRNQDGDSDRDPLAMAEHATMGEATGAADAQCAAARRSNGASHGSRPPLYQRDVMSRSSGERVPCCALATPCDSAPPSGANVTSRPSGGCDAHALAAIRLCNGSVPNVRSALNKQIDATHQAWLKRGPPCLREKVGIDDVEWANEVVSTLL